MLIIQFHFQVYTNWWTGESEWLVKYYIYVLLMIRKAFWQNGDDTVFQFNMKLVLKDSLDMGRPQWKKFGWTAIVASEYCL